MKRVRLLLRVSSNQQLEADGDLTIQRQIVTEYVNRHSDWVIDEKEYFEGSKSAYKNAVKNRDVLTDAKKDAINGEYDILVAYKDDRIGRRMFEICMYVMELKKHNVDIYTVKDGCITPKDDDIMGQMILALRYGNAQKSSQDTGMRVKDTAQKLVERGKFIGGYAPYGYKLEFSGEISKRGRALKHLVIVPEQAEVVKVIYELSLTKEYGSSKIARVLNEDEHFKSLAPKDVWKSGTITSILTNPIYTGHTAYNRRARTNNGYHRLDSNDWIISENSNEKIRIIDDNIWNQTQFKRKCRSAKYSKTLEHKNLHVIKRNDGMLSLIDVAHCGYCGRKLTNGTKYNYWTIKSTGEKRASKTPIYRCQSAQIGIPHNKINHFRADKIEQIVFKCMGDYIEKLQENENIMEEIENNQNHEKKMLENELKTLRKELDKMDKGISIMQSHIPEAMMGEYSLTVDELATAIRVQEAKKIEQKELIKEKEDLLLQTAFGNDELEKLKTNLPTWKKVFTEADSHTQRVLVNKLIDRIDITNEQIVIHFKIRLDDFLPQSRMSNNELVSQSGL